MLNVSTRRWWFAIGKDQNGNVREMEPTVVLILCASSDKITDRGMLGYYTWLFLLTTGSWGFFLAKWVFFFFLGGKYILLKCHNMCTVNN